MSKSPSENGYIVMYETTWTRDTTGGTINVYSISKGDKVRAGDKVRISNVTTAVFEVMDSPIAFADPFSGKNMVPVQTVKVPGVISSQLWVRSSDLVLVGRNSRKITPGTMLESPNGNKFFKLPNGEWLMLRPDGFTDRYSENYLYGQIQSFRDALNTYEETDKCPE